MNSGDFFSILTMVILALFAAVFGILYLYDRTQRFTAWVSASYAAGLIAFTVDSFRTNFPVILGDLVMNTATWSVGLCLLIAYATRLDERPPLRAMALILTAAYAVQSWYSLADPDMTMRAIAANVSCAAILLAAMPILWRARSTPANQAIFWIMTVLTASFIVRPIITFGILSERFTPASYGQSVDTLAFHMTFAVVSLSGAVALLIAAGSDTIARMQRESVVDPLTGVLNRRGYENALENGTERGTGIHAVMMFDIDRFKDVNDSFGHQTGDEILKRIAKIASGIVEHHGEIARVGGEEFAVVLSAPSSPVAKEIAEHLRLAFGLFVHPELPPGASVTASFGLAHAQPGESLKRAMRRADVALYAAKDKGRNCVVEHREEDAVKMAGNSMTVVTS